MSYLLATIKVFTYLYDFITWPIYYFVYSSEDVHSNRTKIRAKRTGDIWTCIDGDLVSRPAPGMENMADLLYRSVQKFPKRKCLGTRELLSEEDEVQPNGRVFKKMSYGDYHWETFEEMNVRVENLGQGLLSLGQKVGQNVLIFAETRAEWQIAVHAAFRFNFPVVTLYATLGDEALVYGINQADVELVLTSDSLVSKFNKLSSSIPSVKHVVYFNNGIFGSDSKVDCSDSSGGGGHLQFHSITDVELMGADSSSGHQRHSMATYQDLAVIMYTSGSTGLPKGVMITHGNLLSMIAAASERIPQFGCLSHDIYIGYLPLAHVLELAAESACVCSGVPIGYSSPLTLSDNSNKIKKGTHGDITVLKPTLMTAVPAIMDRISKSVWEKIDEGGSAKRMLFQWAFNYKMERMMRGMPSPLLDLLVFSKVKILLGGRVRAILSGGAPLSAETQRFMNVCFGIPVIQGYGLTETTGGGTIQDTDDISTGRAGHPLSCCRLKLRNWLEGGYTVDDQPCPRGEVLISGHNVCRGYYKMPDKTAEDFIVDDDGNRWFCTGDIGLFNGNGTLEVIDRKKDLVKLQGGEYISLGKVETAVGVSPFIEQVCIYGDGYRTFPVAIVVPKRNQIVTLGGKLGLAMEFEQLCLNSQVKNHVLKDMQQRAAGKVERFELPTQVYLCPDVWTPESNLVTDALKLKRKPLQDCFQKQIDDMYSSQGS